MKNVYILSVNPYGKIIRKANAGSKAGPMKSPAQLRGLVAVILSFCLIFNTIELKAQNCPASGTHIQNANENTYYPGTQATVSVGATSITLGAIGAGANFGNTPAGGVKYSTFGNTGE